MVQKGCGATGCPVLIPTAGQPDVQVCQVAQHGDPRTTAHRSPAKAQRRGEHIARARGKDAQGALVGAGTGQHPGGQAHRPVAAGHDHRVGPGVQELHHLCAPGLGPGGVPHQQPRPHLPAHGLHRVDDGTLTLSQRVNQQPDHPGTSGRTRRPVEGLGTGTRQHIGPSRRPIALLVHHGIHCAARVGVDARWPPIACPPPAPPRRQCGTTGPRCPQFEPVWHMAIRQLCLFT